MKNNYIRLALTICLFSTTFFAFSQTIEQIKEIKKKSKITKLQSLEKILKRENLRKKQQAETLAQMNGWPLTYTENGSYHALISVSEDNKPIYYKTDNTDAAESTRADYLHNGAGLGLDVEGQGMTAYVWDGGLARSTHQEYDGIGGENRYSKGDASTTLNFHGAHVTGTIIASGFVGAAKGMAPQAKAIGHDWFSDDSEAALAAANGMLISNHSYGYRASDIANRRFGAYWADARVWDEIMYNAPYYLQVISAGNDGNDIISNADPIDGNAQYDKLSGFKTSKNSMIVANGRDAVINSDGSLSSVVRNSSSSEGPTDDLRIKPDIMGNGTALFSSYESADDAYNTISGTSMSSPNVAGSLLLLQQHYNNLNGSFMRSATLKGLALHTADDVGATGPDAEHGWGLMNTKKAAETISENGLSSLVEQLTLMQGETYTITVKSDGVNPLLTSISWTDLPGDVVNGSANDNTAVLVNDLDVKVSQNTDIFEAWKLTGVDSNIKGDNIVDPYERVDIDGASGEYTITVSHKGTLADGPQNFSLIVTGVQSDFSISSSNLTQTLCSDEDTVINFSFNQGTNDTTLFTLENVPTGITANLSVPSLDVDGTFTLTLDNLDNLQAGSYEIDVVANNGNETETEKVLLVIFKASFIDNPMSISYPSNEQKGVPYTQLFLNWNDNPNAESYLVEVSDSPAFTNILATTSGIDRELVLSGLTKDTVYYWRIKPSNNCGEGLFSEIFSFQTGGAEDCTNTYSATDFSNAAISDFSASNVAYVPITINDNLIINRLIVNLEMTHEAVQELVLFIQEPEELNSNNILLAENQCDDTDNVAVTFDDTGSALLCSTTSPAISGIIAPAQSLGASGGKSSLGTWFVAASDDVFSNVGQIDAASITVCTASANTTIPSLTNNNIAITLNDSYVVKTSDIEATTTSEIASQQLYTIVVLPLKGTITKNNVDLGLGDTFTQEDINLGNIAFVNTQTSLFTDSFKVDITNSAKGWLPNQTINLEATTLSSNDFELSNLSIYPNPSSGVINIRFATSSNDKVALELFDLQGRRVYNANFNSSQSLFDESVSVGNIANGIYLLKTSQGNRSTTKRIIISK